MNADMLPSVLIAASMLMATSLAYTLKLTQKLAEVRAPFGLQTLGTYQNKTGECILLSIAYGGDQGTNGMQVHRPEFCYAAQGFQLAPGQAGELVTRFSKLPVTRLEARNGQRIEPMTYWITVGDTAYGSTLQKRLLEVEYSLKGTIPDGVIFRVSSLDADAVRAYATQGEFIKTLVASLSATGRQRIARLQFAGGMP